MATPKIEIDRDQLEELCQRYGVRRLAFFGSVIRDDFDDESDVDILVEFQPDAKVGLAFFSLQEELSLLLGRQVDLSTPGFLSPRIRDRVAGEAMAVYEAA
jgi:predicted nucleotidyltransferase